MAKVTKAEREAAIARLRDLVKPGDTLTTVLRDVSSSGMGRSIDVFLFTVEAGKVQRWWLSRNVATALGWTYDEKREAVRVTGAGMDMGFHLVYTLAYTLFGDKPWRCTGDRCPSNDHSNGRAYPHKFPAEYAGHPVDPAGTCPVWDWGTNEARGGRCGKPASEHPTKRPMHKGGGYALRHEWL